MSDKPKPTKQELLNELESIRASLSESGEPIDLEDIPVLVDTIAHNQPEFEDDTDEAMLRAAYKATLDDAQDYLKNQTPNKTPHIPASDAAAPSDLNSEDYEFELKLEGIIEEQINQENEANAQAEQHEPATSEAEAAPETQLEAKANTSQTRIEVQQRALETPAQESELEDELDIESLVEAHLLDDTPTKPLPGQQSLFDEAAHPDSDVAASGDNTAKSKQEDTTKPVEQDPKQAEKSQKVFDESEVYIRPKASGENPFLPAHIRERLTSSRNQLMEDLAQVDSTLKKPPSSHGKPAQPSAFTRVTPAEPPKKEAEDSEAIQQEIIDQLVAKFLPEIEAELRAHLEKRLIKREEN
ncbi:hypothetical protein KO528_11720 [Saccharophagus degradans]|uniref:hypothetical protein n=1 Tax=Saccharophagus degradans TaxID=86304 RepID=UPI001C0A125A|nr:hypothetical protein [Saccharophagus degradans]MBU2986020.1 hypothetical protein [Saccharophagus degradans]